MDEKRTSRLEGLGAMDGMIGFEASDEARWQAVLGRVETGFLYAVTTMGVYCRTGCPSRAPLRINVRFFADAGAAEAAGFRACKRCDPKGERAAIHRAAVAAACAMIEAEEAMPGLARLAEAAGYAKHHFLRLFKEITGVTPRSYAESVRARRLGAALAAGARVADAVAEAGYGSESRVYGQPSRVLGMTPGAARRGGEGEVIRAAMAESALGPLLVGATERGVCFIGFGEGEEALRGDLAARFPRALVQEADEGLRAVVQRVVDFCAEPRAALDLPLDLRGTAFQRQVWEGLQRIPFGEVTHYAAFAESIGRGDAVRAVARAIASNPVSLAVPCHRVVGKGGELTGYRWGLGRKRALLAKERGGATGDPALGG